MITIWVGIDPGKSGGVAAIYSTGKIEFHRTPIDEVAISVLISRYSPILPACPDCGDACNLGSTPTKVIACIEQVGGFVNRTDEKGNQRPQQGHSMFEFGQSYGFLRGCLASSGYIDGKTLHSVVPQCWLKSVRIPPRKRSPKETDSQWKGRLKAECQRLFPQLKVTLKVADALLIARYCQLTYGG